MDPIRFAISNPVKVSVGVLLLLLFGAISLVLIPIQLTPSVETPIVRVTTEWTGRSPEEVEKEIIEPQEDVLKNVASLRKMVAVAFQGRAEIELEFFIGTDIRAARQEVADSLREVPEYPEETDEPVIDSGEGGEESPIAWLLLKSETPDFDVQSLGDPAEERIKPFLERIEGVSEARVYGGRVREVHIEIDPRRVAQRGITFNQLRDALRLENVNISAGDMPEGIYNVRIRTVGEYDDLRKIRETIVAYTDGGPVRVRDLAEVKLTYDERRSFVRSKADVSLAMPVYRESDANVIRVMEDLRERVKRINTDLLPRMAMREADIRGLAEPPEFSIEQVYDETVYIYDSLRLVRNNLIIGGTLAVLVLLVYLEIGRRPLLVIVGTPTMLALMVIAQLLSDGPAQYGVLALLAAVGLGVLSIARPAGVIALAIPISIIGTFVAMAAAGRNLNVISLAGLAFAVGMVVDAAIVVLENIDRHLAMGKAPGKAAYDGAKEVWGAILASTLTTLAVFIPVLTIQEEAGQLFRDIALAICAAVSLSLLVSVTVIPTASGRLLRPHGKAGEDGEPERRSEVGPSRWLGNLLSKMFGGIATSFSSLIYFATARNPFGVGARVLVVGFFTLAALVGAAILMPPTDYLPRGNQNLVFGALLTPPGYNIEHDEFIAERIEKGLRPYWEADDYGDLDGLPPAVHPFTQQPIENIPPIRHNFIVSFFGGMFMGAISADDQNVAPLADLLTAKMNVIPASIGFAQQRSLFGRGLGGTRSIEVEVTGDLLSEVRQAAAALQDELRMQYGFAKVQPDPRNFDLPGPELRVEIDQLTANELGINTDSLGQAVRALVDGIVVGDYRLEGETIDIKALRDPAIRFTPDDLRTVPLAYRDRDGRVDTIPLSSVARIYRTDAPQTIRRVEESRAVTLTVTPPDTQALEQASNHIAALIDRFREEGRIPNRVDVNQAGSASKLAEVRRTLLGAPGETLLQTAQNFGFSRIFLALVVTYLLMAALFESWLYPFVIMFSVPLATVGGFMGLAIVHAIIPTQLLDTLTMLGFVILIGVVVNNAILIVHQALNFMRGIGETAADQRDPLDPREAIRESVRTRIRPVFMTTTTSVFGMLPLVVMPGSGSELYRGLGSVVLGGLVVATAFTLIVVPLLMSLVIDARIALARLMGSEQTERQIAAGTADDPGLAQ